MGRLASVLTAMLCSMPLATNAEVVATNALLTADGYHGYPNVTYTVPTEKVLIIQYIVIEDPSNTWVTCLLPSAAGWEFKLTEMGSKPFVCFTPSLNITGGGIIKLWPYVNLGDQKALLFGLLVDRGDLYAAIGSRFSDVMLAQNSLAMRIDLASVRPAILKLETSTDLLAWAQVLNPQIQKETTAGRFAASVPTDADRGFVRVLARARK